MRSFLPAAVLICCAAIAQRADEPQPKTPAPLAKAAPSLKGGEPAPALKVDKWLQGDEVKRFEPGHVYVVEFWATWCGPCILFMPHLADVQARYKDQVTVIGFTHRDPKNSAEMVAAFVKKRGPSLKYTFAYGNDNTTWDAWMEAAGRHGIPCSFVVDKVGQIAYIGHPMFLDFVLPKVVAGKATAREISDEISRIQAEFSAIVSTETFFRDPKAGLQALKAFEAKYPLLADFFMSAKVKLSTLPKYGKPGEAKEYAEALVAKAIAHGDPAILGLASSILRRGEGKDNPELQAIAVKAAEARLTLLGGNDAGALIDLADAYFVAGDKAKAKECASTAMTAAAGESAEMRQYIEKEAKKLSE